MRAYSANLSAFILLLVATPSHSFQISSPAISSRIITNPRISSSVIFRAPFVHATKQRPSALLAVSDDEINTKQPLKLSSDKPNGNNFLQQLSKLRPLLLSLTIFLLPLFLSLPSWAVQSGGRIGGSVGGSSRSSSSYSSGGSYSRGFSRGYSSGYYSRPSVVVSPGITPYYR